MVIIKSLNENPDFDYVFVSFKILDILRDINQKHKNMNTF